MQSKIKVYKNSKTFCYDASVEALELKSLPLHCIFSRFCLKEADEKAEAEATLVETFDNLRPIKNSDPDPEVTFPNDSKQLFCEDDNAAFAFSSDIFKAMEGPFFMLC